MLHDHRSIAAVGSHHSDLHSCLLMAVSCAYISSGTVVVSYYQLSKETFEAAILSILKRKIEFGRVAAY